MKNLNKQEYRTTRITDIFKRTTEPDYIIQLLFDDDDGDFFDQVGGTIFKEKVETYSNGLYVKAPSFADITFSRKIYAEKSRGHSLEIRGMLLIGLGVAEFKVGDEFLSFPNVLGYSFYGVNSSMIIQVNYKIIGNLGLFVQGQANFLQTMEISGMGVNQPAELQGSLGVGAGLHFGF